MLENFINFPMLPVVEKLIGFFQTGWLLTQKSICPWEWI